MDTSGSVEVTGVGTAQVARDKLVADLRTVIADTEELLKATADQAGARIAAARVKLQASLKSANARIAEAQEATSARARVAIGTTEDYVRANPWQALGIAAGVGVVLGVLLARR